MFGELVRERVRHRHEYMMRNTSTLAVDRGEGGRGNVGKNNFFYYYYLKVMDARVDALLTPLTESNHVQRKTNQSRNQNYFKNCDIMMRNKKSYDKKN